MRFLRGAVAASLTLNLMLGAAFWLGPRAPKSEAAFNSPAPLPLQAQAVEKAVTNFITKAAPPKLPDWRAVESDDYKRYIANLRAIGCPEKTIRDVIVADVNDLYRQRYREIFPPTNRVEYWKPGNPMANLFDETKLAKEQELRKEKREVLRTLVGSDYDDEQDASTIQLDSFNERLLNFLTPEKRTAMKELEDKFAVRMMKTYKDTWRGNDGPADAVKAEKDDAMMEILTPEEKLEYDLRRSDTAMFLRVGLGQFEVTEEEFRAMYPSLKTFLADADKFAFGAVIRGQTDPRPEAAAARLGFQASLKASLGEERLRQLIARTGWNLDVEGQR
jgi:hypothetical protein